MTAYEYPGGTLRYIVTSVGTSVYDFEILVQWTGSSVTIANADVVTGRTDILTESLPSGAVILVGVTVTNAQGDVTTYFSTDAAHCQTEVVAEGLRYSWNLGDASTEEETNTVDANGDPVYFAGFNDLVFQLHVPQPVRGSSGSRTGARIEIWQQTEEDFEFICHVPRFRNLRWSDEMNTAGAGSFEISLEDPIFYTYPQLQEFFNIVKIYVDGQPVKAWIIEDMSPVQVGQNGPADRWVTFTGRGPISALENAVVYPEYGLRELVDTTRIFNFSSNKGDWYDQTVWVAPSGIRWDNAAAGKKNLPKDWPDKFAYWLWAPNFPPDHAAPSGTCWFRTEFDLTVTTPVVIYMTADNSYTAYLNGQQIMATLPNDMVYGYRKTGHYTTILPAGHHVLAAKVTNLRSYTTSSKNSFAGYMFTMYRADGLGKATADPILRSKLDGKTLVKPYGKQPGWSGAGILKQLMQEAQDRGVRSMYALKFDYFDNVIDSDGNRWDDVQERRIEVGTTDLWDIATQIIEIGLDIDVNTELEVRAYKHRGTDLSDVVILRPGRDITAHSPTAQGSRVRNQALVKFAGGWIELSAPQSQDLYGRREVGLSMGSATTTRQTRYAGQAALREVIEPDITIPVSITNLSGPQPYTDFNLGDVIRVPGLWTEYVAARLMSISAQLVGENNSIQYDLDFYPTTDLQDVRSMVTATGGTFHDVSGLYAHEVLTDSPWGFWQLNDDGTKNVLADASGHKYSMSVVYKAAGKPLFKQPGPVDQAMKFNSDHSGTKDGEFDQAHARTTVADTKRFAYRACTLELWIQRLSSTSTAMSMLTMYNGGTTIVYDLGISPTGHAYFRYRKHDGTFGTVISSAVLSTSRFTHVVGSVGARGLRLYINGVLDQHTSASTPDLLPCQAYLRADLDSQADTVVVADPAVYFQQLLDARIPIHYNAAEYSG